MSEVYIHVRIQKVLSEGFNTDNVFFLSFSRWDGERIEIPQNVGHHRPPAKRH